MCRQFTVSMGYLYPKALGQSLYMVLKIIYSKVLIDGRAASENTLMGRGVALGRLLHG